MLLERVHEAMMLLIYENYHDHWVDKHEKKEVVISPSIPSKKECGIASGAMSW